jgi:hypothetical protein
LGGLDLAGGVNQSLARNIGPGHDPFGVIAIQPDLRHLIMAVGQVGGKGEIGIRNQMSRLMRSKDQARIGFGLRL